MIRPMRIDLRDPASGRSYPVREGKALLGSSAQCDIVLDDASVSPEHARIRLGTLGIELDDLGSAQGTWVNGLRVDKHFIGPRDEVRLGGATLVVSILADGEEGAKPSVCKRCGAALEAGRTRRLSRDGESDAALCDGCERRRGARPESVRTRSETTPLPPRTPQPDARTPRQEGTPPGAPPAAFTLAGYETLAVIGEGSQGTVYKMRHAAHGAVAVKRLGPGHGRKARARFKREAEVLRLLSHPNLVRLVETKEAGDSLVIVMELVDGPSLFQLISRGPLPAGRVLRIGRQVADGLAHAAASGVIHRDIKPSNILVGPGDVAKITDFGLATYDDDTGTRLTMEGQWIGTPHYMAPEQVDGKRPDPRTDVYALGVTLYQTLTGVLPFSAKTPSELFKKILAEPAPLRPIEHRAGAAARALFERMLAKQVEDRPSPDELVRLLDGLPR
jgi:hypothetical protein